MFLLSPATCIVVVTITWSTVLSGVPKHSMEQNDIAKKWFWDHIPGANYHFTRISKDLAPEQLSWDGSNIGREDLMDQPSWLSNSADDEDLWDEEKGPEKKSFRKYRPINGRVVSEYEQKKNSREHD